MLWVNPKTHKERITMTPEDKIARQRLDVLELAKTLGNVSEACRRRVMTRPHSSLKGLPPSRARIAGAALN
jgi:hypothetical protein